MGKFQPREWYDEIYAKEPLPSFKPPWPRHSNTYIRMPELARRIADDEAVLDVACGPAILAAALHLQGHTGKYTGIDFSKVQIGRTEGCPHQNADYFLDDINRARLFIDYPDGVVVMAEILEHLDGNGDLKLLKRIQKGRRILITVPTMDDDSHVRIFSRTGEDAIERYGNLVDIKDHKIVYDRRIYWGRVGRHLIPRKVSPVFHHILEGCRT